MLPYQEWLISAAKPALGKLFSLIPDLFRRRRPDFTRIVGTYQYSHYVGQNHVRQGGEKRIYQAIFSMVAFNPTSQNLAIRDLTLICTINGLEFPFHLYDNTKNGWCRDYNLPEHTVSNFSWVCLPEGHGILPGAEGILPFEDDDVIAFYFVYLNAKGRCRRIGVDTLRRFRLPVEQIVE